MESPLVFHSKVMASAMILQARSSDAETRGWSAMTSIRYRLSTIELLKDEIQRCSTQGVSEALITAVSTLAIYEKFNPEVLPQVHPRSPLATWNNNLHLFGRIEIEESHMKAFYLLVKQKGGLANVETTSSRGLLAR